MAFMDNSASPCRAAATLLISAALLALCREAMSEEKYLAAKSKMTKNEYDVCIRAAKAKLCENNFIKDIFINAA